MDLVIINGSGIVEVELVMEQASIFSVTVIDIVSGKNHVLPRLRYVTGNCDCSVKNSSFTILGTTEEPS